VRGLAICGVALLCVAAWGIGMQGAPAARVAPGPAVVRETSGLPEAARPPVSPKRDAAWTAPVQPDPVPREECATDEGGDLEGLRERVTADAEALGRLLEEFRLVAGSPRGERIAIVLGQVRDPLVEQAAVELVRGGGGQAQRIAGLDLLDRLDLENEETRRVVLEVLWTEPSAEVQRAALFALHCGVPGPDARREVLGAIVPLTRSTDAEVRRRAVIAAAEWAPDAAALDPVLGALRDASPDVRAGAAFALGEARVAAPAVPQALARTVADEGEDWEVRRIAWGSLGRYPLREDEYAIYDLFRRQVEAVGEASGPATAGDAEE